MQNDPAILLIIGTLCAFHSPAQAPPGFLTRTGPAIEVKEHETVRLRCTVESIDNDVAIMWQRVNVDESIISINGDIMSSDNRHRLDHTGNDYSLIIENVAPYDSGDYLCIITGDPPLNLRQTLDVHVPPSVSMVPEISPLVVKPDEPLTLTCYGNGNPAPEIVWRRIDKRDLPGGHGGSYNGMSLSYAKADESMEGAYECIASNGIGHPAKKQIAVVVHYKPKIRIPQEYYIVEPGKPLNLSCLYMARPTPQIDWIFGDYPIQRNGSKYKEFGSVQPDGWTATILSIHTVQLHDLGDYNCRIHNHMGGSEGSIHVTSLPGPVLVEPTESSEHSISLLWSTESPTTITRYKLEYRLPGVKAWTIKEMEPPQGDSPQDGKFKMNYILEGLAAGTEYEIRVTAMNVLGWGSLPENRIIVKTGGQSATSQNTASVSAANSRSSIGASRAHSYFYNGLFVFIVLTLQQSLTSSVWLQQ